MNNEKDDEMGEYTVNITAHVQVELDIFLGDQAHLAAFLLPDKVRQVLR